MTDTQPIRIGDSMLTLPIRNAAGDVTSWKVPLDDERAIHIIRQQDGGLTVIDGGATRAIEAVHAEWFLGLCRHCLSYEEMADYAGFNLKGTV